ncbi:hypothetical protein F5B22DRAFT_492053 [Xylaria bambusicola]|uniref:uncharacterized protein n=1 Tax=Xylaria bambusicola TaxID=326684 RepID=UPI002008B8CB|nr:uncharacterized protein F5B22DRAFT_492053 [Xylaria bambusicola]KAI0505803.1 hypothetical protein F5B22DRAFT_492053 [Xylaria bambusicola]
MLLKRKRSDSELSTSTTSTFNSPPRVNCFSPESADVSMDDFTFTAHYPVSPLSRFSNTNLHVPGRTMKRLRDNRPSEHEVHQRTLDMLYTAQRQHSQGTSTESNQQQQSPTAVQPAPSCPSSSLAPSHQRNLHSFWNLPSRPSALPAACLPSIAVDTPTECEDCGQKLCGDDENMMDVDDALSGSQATSCGVCGKHVCSHCSITHLGERRRCLSCAGTTSRSANVAKDTVSWARGMSNWLC